MVALSGGVDSAVAGLLCKKAGFEVLGVTLYLFNGQEETLQRAEEIAKVLNIEHHLLDIREQFREEIIQYFLKSYQAGLTPNPCAICNRKIKFDLLLKFARERLGAELLATGHYVSLDSYQGYLTLRTSQNKKKDQSYFLALVKAEHLPFLMFPLGNFSSKEEVRALAHLERLPVTEAKESQDICFLKGQALEEFLKEYLGEQEGEIIYQGRVVGKHRGFFYYTIGQRKGLNLPLGKKLYITKIDPKENRILLGEKEELERDYLYVEGELNLFIPLKNWMKPSAQIRYRTEKVVVEDVVKEGNLFKVKLGKKVRGVTPGQICAFYEEEFLLGGAIIAPYP